MWERRRRRRFGNAPKAEERASRTLMQDNNADCDDEEYNYNERKCKRCEKDGDRDAIAEHVNLRARIHMGGFCF